MTGCWNSYLSGDNSIELFEESLGLHIIVSNKLYVDDIPQESWNTILWMCLEGSLPIACDLSILLVYVMSVEANRAQVWRIYIRGRIYRLQIHVKENTKNRRRAETLIYRPGRQCPRCPVPNSRRKLFHSLRLYNVLNINVSCLILQSGRCC